MTAVDAETIQQERHVTILQHLPPNIEANRVTVGTIISNDLHYRKFCDRWAPRLLSGAHKLDDCCSKIVGNVSIER